MAQSIRRGSRLPVSLFEPTALWGPVSEPEHLRDRMGRLCNQITPQRPGQSPGAAHAVEAHADKLNCFQPGWPRADPWPGHWPCLSLGG